MLTLTANFQLFTIHSTLPKASVSAEEKKGATEHDAATTKLHRRDGMILVKPYFVLASNVPFGILGKKFIIGLIRPTLNLPVTTENVVIRIGPLFVFPDTAAQWSTD